MKIKISKGAVVLTAENAGESQRLMFVYLGKQPAQSTEPKEKVERKYNPWAETWARKHKKRCPHCDFKGLNVKSHITVKHSGTPIVKKQKKKRYARKYTCNICADGKMYKNLGVHNMMIHGARASTNIRS